MNQVRPDRMDFWKAKIGVFLFSYKSTPEKTQYNLILLPLLTCKSAGRRSFMLHESSPTFSP